MSCRTLNIQNIPAAVTTTTAGHTGCASGLVQYIADGYCDDKNNIEECQWDGGDCCGDNVDTDYCEDCACLDPGMQGDYFCLTPFNP